MKCGGWIGAVLGGGTSYKKVREVCAAGNIEACEKIKKEYQSTQLTWAGFGNFDKEQIIEQCDYLGIENPFSENYINVMYQFKNHIGFHKMMGLKRALKYMNMDFEGNHHSGADDAYNAAKILREILE